MTIGKNPKHNLLDALYVSLQLWPSKFAPAHFIFTHNSCTIEMPAIHDNMVQASPTHRSSLDGIMVRVSNEVTGQQGNKLQVICQILEKTKRADGKKYGRVKLIQAAYEHAYCLIDFDIMF